MTSKKRQALAYHEAGHAVAAHDLGIRFRYVTIEPDDQAGSLGHCASTLPRWFQPDVSDDRQQGWAERDIVMTFAGEEAERLVTGRGNNVGTENDRRSVWTVAQFVTNSDEETTAFIKWLRIRARQHVNTPRFRVAVAAVADALLEHTRLTKDEVARTVVDALLSHITEREKRTENDA